MWQPYPFTSAKYSINVGNYVNAIKTGTNYYSKALVIAVNNGVYTIQFVDCEDGTIQNVNNVNELLYYQCDDCYQNPKQVSFSPVEYIYQNKFGINCVIPVTNFLNNLVN